MASLGLGWVGEPALAHIFEPIFDAVLPERMAFIGAHGLAVFVAFTLITFFHMVMGEQVPKMVALQHAESTILLTAQPTRWVSVAFRPLIAVVYWSTDFVLKLLRVHREGEKHLVYTVEELEMLVIASTEKGHLEESESEMIHRVFNFADLTAQQIMAPRTEIIGVPTSISFDGLLDLVRREGKSRYPVYQDTLDNIVGIVYVKDVFKAMRPESFEVRSITRDALTVPESLSVDELLALMKSRRTHMAIVIDEFGGTAGLTTLEDVLEVIVGEVQDEFERPATDFEHLPDGSTRVNGLLLIDEFNRRFGAHVEDPDFDTIGGFVFGQIGRKPEIGDEVQAAGLRFRVDVLDGLRIERLVVEPDANDHSHPAEHPEPATA
jgi:CBS domain containing-hemolysin-like protein